MSVSSLQALPVRLRHNTCQQCRQLHSRISHAVPPPTPFVPDTKTFLTLIGRDLTKHESKIPSWEALFSLNSQQLRESGVEPARARRYLLWWRERYRKGRYGIGGDLQNVSDGVAELRIAGDKAKVGIANPPLSPSIKARLEAPSSAESSEAGESSEPAETSEHNPPQSSLPLDVQSYDGISVTRQGKLNRVSCQGVEYIKGEPQAAILRVREGLWEQKRGIKRDGGERRRAQVRAKRAAAARRAAR